ncbi:MAG: elongation factor 1-beta [Candidatus Thermoplasmatota archaeon]|nr:elongation factor 1-beta [Candidatus Thermoplasmatota archaeon]
MGKVIVGLRVLPASVETNLEEIKNAIKSKIPQYATLGSINEKYIAFGLRALELAVIIPDTAGGSEGLEKIISSIKGVSSVEIIGTGLL